MDRMAQVASIMCQTSGGIVHYKELDGVPMFGVDYNNGVIWIDATEPMEYGVKQGVIALEVANWVHFLFGNTKNHILEEVPCLCGYIGGSGI